MLTRRASVAPLVLMGAGAVILLGIIISAALLSSTTAQLSASVIQSRIVRTAASNELETLLDAETGQRGYLLTADPAYLAPYLEAKKNASQTLDRLAMIGQDNKAAQPAIQRLSVLSRAKLAELDSTVRLFQSGHRKEAFQLVRTDRGKVLMDGARGALKAIISDTEVRVSADLASLNSSARTLRAVTIAGGVLIFLFAAASIILLFRYINDAVRARGEVEAFNETLEQRVENRTAALARANDEIQRFAYIVSHDLRAPLVNIMGFTSELELGGKALTAYFADEKPELKAAAVEAANAGVPEAVGFIRSSTNKMDRLINAILKLSREGRRELVADDVDLRPVLENIFASLKHQIDETQTVVELPRSLPVLRSDRLALEQVFSNLIDNALKYLQPGRPGAIRLEADGFANLVFIKIIDNGRGIAEQDLERVFELFRRAGRQDKPGEGIGLANVRALVRRLGGDITVSSKLGEGSAFQVTLPRTLPTETSTPS